ncbi:MAG: hypothetical protein Q9161_005321 [Pseudevernia consocians]
MVRNIVVLGGSSHPSLTETICDQLGLPPGNVLLSKFSVGETRVEIKESVRGKDVYIIQSGSGTGLVNGVEGLNKDLNKLQLDESGGSSQTARFANYTPKRSNTLDSTKSDISTRLTVSSVDASQSSDSSKFQPRPGYTAWVSQAGTLVADLLTSAGADHVITMDLHDPQYQGFFDIPVDNLYGRPILKRYIQTSIPNYQEAVVVSPDAGGAKRATAIADSLGMPFALIHKERRPTKITDRQNATMMLVGDVVNRTAILIDDLADTSNTITRAAKLLKKEGAKKVYALITHGVLSGDAIERINASALDKVIVTNSVPQEEHEKLCPKLEVLDVGHVFAEAIRRVHHGESISVLFQYD